MVMAYGTKDEPIRFKQYIIKRIARIIPLYYFAMALMLIYYFIRIKLLGVESLYTPNLKDTILHSTLLQAWIPGKATTLNTAAWSLSVEALFYMVFAILFNFIRKYPLKWLLIGSTIVYIVSQITFHSLILNSTNSATASYHPLLHLNSFIIGILAGVIAVRYLKHNNKSQIKWLSLIVIITLLLLYFKPTRLNYHNGLISPIFALFIVLLSIDNSILTKLFRQKAFTHLGEISYGIYILQFPVFFFYTAALTYFGYKINQPLFFIFIFILISDLAYRFIEKPLRLKINNYSLPKLNKPKDR